MDLYYQHQPAPAPARTTRPWSKEEDKAFEAALVAFPEQAPDRWDRVAGVLPGRTPQDVWEHYQALVADVDLIERGAIDIPTSWDDDDGDTQSAATDRRAGKPRGDERRRGIPWSEEEHKYVTPFPSSSGDIPALVPSFTRRKPTNSSSAARGPALPATESRSRLHL
jgi:hypothetical protein